MNRFRHIPFLLFLLVFLQAGPVAWAQDGDPTNIFCGGDKSKPASGTSCTIVLSEDFGENISVYKGGNVYDMYLAMFCSAATQLVADGETPLSLFKGGPSIAGMVFVACASDRQLCPPDEVCKTIAGFSGGPSHGIDLVSCALPAILTSEDEPMSLYKGGPSNDLSVACLEKPAIIEVNLPIYQGGRSRPDIVDCFYGYQLGPTTAYGGSISRPFLPSCEALTFPGGGPFFGGSSRVMMSETACHEIIFEGGGDMYRSGKSEFTAVTCSDTLTLGEPLGGYFRGGPSRDGNVDCVAPPCMDLEEATITTKNALPVCAGKTVILESSKADHYLWQRYDGTDWVFYSEAPTITITEDIDIIHDLRLIGYGLKAGCVDTSEVFRVEFVTDIPKPTITVDGSITVCIDGSVALRSSPSQEYRWSNNATTPVIWVPYAEIGPVSREYTVTITDANGCSAVSDPVTLFAGNSIALPSAGIITNSPTPVEICAGNNAVLTALPGYNDYFWSDGTAHASSIVVDKAGKYTVRVKDENNCEVTADSVEVIVHYVKPEITAASRIVCNGNDLQLSLAPHRNGIRWYRTGDATPIGSGATVDVNAAGDYYASIDTLNCTFYSDVFTVSESAITTVIKRSQEHLCEGGYVSLESENEATVQFWYFNDETQPISGSSTIDVIRPGIYKLVTMNKDGCRDSATFDLVEKPITLIPRISYAPGSLNFCPDKSTTLAVDANESLSGLHIEWSNGETGASIVVSDSARYSAAVTDANGCPALSDTVHVTIYPTLKPEISTSTGKTVICGNETLQLLAIPISENNGYQYRWSNGATTPHIDLVSGEEGDYFVEITTAEGCTFKSDETLITVASAPAKPAITALSPFVVKNDTVWICPNQYGTVTLESSTASEYYWSNGVESLKITPDTIGKFAVTVVYDSGCEAVSDTVVIALRANDVFVALTETDDHLCPDGKVHLTVVDGDENQITGGIKWFERLDDNNTISLGTTNILEVTAAGKYFAVVELAGSCTETTDPFEIFAYESIKPVIYPSGLINLCPYDSVKLQAPDGVAWAWVKNADEQSISDEQSMWVRTDGSYAVTVTDIFGCIQTSDPVTVNVYAERFPVVTFSADTVCQGEVVKIWGPIEGKSFIWNDNKALTGQELVFNDASLTGNRRYYVEVTYEDGCVYESPVASFRVNRKPNEPEFVRVGSNQICPERSVALALYASDDLTYVWEYSESEDGPKTIIPTDFTTIVADKAGWYTVTGTVITTGCSNTFTEYVNLSPASVEISPGGPVNLCETGRVKLTAYTAEPDVTYLWSTGDTTKSIYVNSPDKYYVTIFKSVAHPVTGEPFTCSIQSPSVTVTSASLLPAPEISPKGPLTLCEGGKATLTTGGSPTNTYQWYKNGEPMNMTSHILEVKESGEYYVTFVDKTCTLTSNSIRVTVNPMPEVRIIPGGTQTICAGQEATLTAVAGGSNPSMEYTYLWSPTGETTQSIKAAPGTYMVTATAKGCSTVSTPTVVSLATGGQTAPAPTVPPVTVCSGEKAMLVPVSNNPDLEYTWWDTAADGTPVGDGPSFETTELTSDFEIWVSAHSEALCESPRTKVIARVGQKANIVFASPGVLCTSDDPVTLQAAPEGGDFVGDGVTGDRFDPRAAGSGLHKIYYTLNPDGCASTDSIEIDVKQAPNVDLSAIPRNVCAGSDQFTLDAVPAGGIFRGKGVAGTTFDPATAGVGAHWVAYTYTVDGSECIGKDSVIINVHAPDPKITNVQSTVNPDTRPFELTALPPGGDFYGDGVVGPENGVYSFYPSMALNGANIVTYVYVDEYGCSGTTSIIIAVSGDLSVDMSDTPDAVCEGETLTLTVPSYEPRGVTPDSVCWLLDGEYFDPTTPVTYADNRKKLTYKIVIGANEKESPEVYITVNAVPLVGNITGLQTLCVGETLNLTAPEITERGTPAAPRYWMLANERIDDISTHEFTIDDNGKTLKYVAESACGTGESAAVTIVVHPLLTPSVSGTLAINCANSEENYTVTGLPGAISNYTYLWTIVGGSILDDADADPSTVLVKWTRTGADTLSLSITDKTTGCNASAETVVTVAGAAPTFVVTNPEPACSSTEFDLADAVPVNASVDYIFYEGDQTTTLTSTMVETTYPGAYYYVRAVDNTNTARCRSELYPIFIAGKALPEVSFAQSNFDVCNGAHTPVIIFNSTISGSTFAWTNNTLDIGLPASGTGTSLPSFQAANTGNTAITAGITVTPTGNGCVGLPKSFTVTIHPSPALTLVNDTMRVCSAADLTSVVSVNTSVDYLWFRSDGTTTVNTPAAEPIGEGDTLTYYVRSQLTAPPRCLSALTPFTVIGRSLPVITVTDPSTLCQDSIINLKKTVSSNVPVDYTFFKSDQITPVDDPEKVFPGIGSNIYYIVATDRATGCDAALQAVRVNVQKRPVARIEAEDDDGQFCYNTSIELHAKTDAGTISWVGWYDEKGQANNTDRFGDTHIADVTYRPDISLIGKTVTLKLRVQDQVCGYLDTAKIELLILPLATDAELTIVDQPRGVQEVCADTIYEVKIKADQLGDLVNVELSLRDINATQLVIKDAKIKQPYDAPNFELLGVISDPNDIKEKKWSLPSILEHGDSVLVQVTVAAECEFFSGTGLQFALNAKNTCGGALPEIAEDTDPYRIVQESDEMNKYTVTGSFNINTVTNATNDTVVWHLEAFTDGKKLTDDEKESLVILVPAGLKPVADSFKPIQNVTTDRNDISVVVDEFGTEFTIPMLPNLTENDVMIAELKFTAIGAPCGKYDFYAEVLYTDSLDCHGTTCAYHITRGGYYPSLEVERYVISGADTLVGRTIDGLWYGENRIVAETKFYAGDEIYVDFYIDQDNDGQLSPGDNLVHTHTYTTEAVEKGDSFVDRYEKVPFVKEKQLLAEIWGNSLCEKYVIPIATLAGTDTVCRADTAYYYTVAGMKNYSWNVIRPDASSGATPIRIPLEGSNTGNYTKENVARIVWRKEGNFTVWTQYTTPDETKKLDITYFPVRVNERPTVSLTRPDTTVCEGASFDLSRFFRVTGIDDADVSYYRIEDNSSLTFLSDHAPVYVSPTTSATYKAIAVSRSTSCTSLDIAEFDVNVSAMPQIVNISAIMQPDCGDDQGNIMLTIVGGNGNYEYNFDNGSSFTDLPSDHIIKNLSVGDYQIYLREKSGGCPVSISEPVSLNAIDYGLYATAEVIDATDCRTDNGIIKLIVSGGTAPYQYKVNSGSYTTLPGDGIIGTGFAAGTYGITITDADGRCTTTAGHVQVNTTSGFVMTLTQETPADCDVPGTLKVSLSGGTPDYRYRLSGKGWMAMTGTAETLPLSAGLHRVYAEDADGCEVSDTVRIDNTSGLTAYVAGTTKVSCNGSGLGDIRVNITDGATPLSYSTDGGKNFMTVDEIPMTLSTPVGTYQIHIKDFNGCTVVLGDTRIERDDDFVALSVTGDTIRICSAETIDLYAASAISVSANVDTVVFFTDRSYSNPLPDNNINQTGKYYVRAESNKGCFAYDSVHVKTKILDPIIIDGDDKACVGDRIIFSVADEYETYEWIIASGTGGTPEGAGNDYREYFTWSDAGTKSVSITVTDDNGCTGTFTKTIIIDPRAGTGPIYRIPNSQ